MPDIAASLAREQTKKQVGWSGILAVAIVSALAISAIFGFSRGGYQVAAAALFLAGSFVLVGAFIGFLFGIPRSLQSTPNSNDRQNGEAVDTKKRSPLYQPNTNLEQISDWLTKILVGVGLTQLASINEIANKAGLYFGPSINLDANQSPVVVSIIVYFSVSGFLFSYLWTRLFLGGQLAEADLRLVAERVEEVVEAQQNQALADASALSLSTRYLSSARVDDISIPELKDAIAKASPAIKVQVFYQAREARSQGFHDSQERWRIERTVPIFEALVAADHADRFHRNHAQLGFALKDKKNPDYESAARELSTAIDIRGPATEAGWAIYEFNRAICTIKLDPDFQNNSPSQAERQEQILADLRVAVATFHDLLNNNDIAEWLKLNGINDVSADRTA